MRVQVKEQVKDDKEIILNEKGEFVERVKEKTSLEELNQKVTKISPFDFVNAINYSKANLFPVDDFSGIRSEIPTNQYARFIINKSLSYFPDTIAFANIANTSLGEVPPYSHFDFLRFTVSKKKRFSKWFKPIDSEALRVLCEYFNVNRQKAEEYLKILSNTEVNAIKKEFSKNGRERK